VARRDPHRGLGLENGAVDLAVDLLREIVQLWAEPGLHPLHRPCQRLAQRRETGAPPTREVDQRGAEELGPLLDHVPAVPVAVPHLAAGSGQTPVVTDRRQKAEQHGVDVVTGMVAETERRLDTDTGHRLAPEL